MNYNLERFINAQKEDYDIASEMAYYYGFSVNERNNLDHESMPLSCMDIMNISLYSKRFLLCLSWFKRERVQFYWVFSKNIEINSIDFNAVK